MQSGKLNRIQYWQHNCQRQGQHFQDTDSYMTCSKHTRVGQSASEFFVIRTAGKKTKHNKCGNISFNPLMTSAQKSE